MRRRGEDVMYELPQMILKKLGDFKAEICVNLDKLLRWSF